MAQTQYTTYKAPVESFTLGQKGIGVNKPGRFNGYDHMSSNGGLSISIEHTGAIRKTTKTGDAANQFGAVLMPTGNIIHDTDILTFTIGGNIGNPNIRRDILICEHNYQEIPGGTHATYSIIQGNSETRPELPDPKKQVIIGTFEVAAGGTNFEAIKYIPEIAQLPGDMTPDDLFKLIEGKVKEAAQTDGGENNTMANVGAGIGLYKEKQGVQLRIKSLISTDGSIEIVSNLPDHNEVDLKTNMGKIVMTDSLVLTNSHHNKTIIIKVSADRHITIPTGLRTDFTCAIIQHGVPRIPEGNTLSAYDEVAQPRVHFNFHTGVKVLSKGAKNFIAGPGSAVLIECVGPINYYALLGDLI